MIITVKNSAPFQILTSAMVIGPSQTGYQLEVAADGRNFSPLFSVGPNVTRQATNLSSGAYYRLNGNVGDVVVNWRTSCVTEGGEGGSGTELQPVADFPLNAVEGTVISYTGSSSASGVYQYDGNEWTEVGANIDLSTYWTSAETKTYVDSAVTDTQNQLNEISGMMQSKELVISTAFNQLSDEIDELSGATPSTEEIELPIAAAVNDLKENIEARLDQQYYKKAEVDNIAARKMGIAEVDVHIENYVEPAIAEINDTIAGVNDNIEDKELATSAAINDLNTATVKSSVVKNIWSGTQSEYDAIVAKDTATLYIIKD